MANINVVDALEQELNNYKESTIKANELFRKFYVPLLDANGELPFEQLSPEQQEEYASLALNKGSDEVIATSIQEFISSKSSIAPIDLPVRSSQEIIEYLEKMEKPIEYSESDVARFTRIMGTEVPVTTKTTSIREFRDFYMDSLCAQLAKNLGVQVGTPEFEALLSQVCTDVVKRQNADRMVEEMSNGVDVLGEAPAQSIRKTIGFTAPWLLGLITGIVVTAVVIFGLVFIK